MKWQFVLKDTPKPKYIVCNADESEPGTFKDHLLMERNPHLLFEGCLIGCYAIGAKVAYIYIRGEFLHVQNVLEQQLEEAYAKGYVGKNVMGLGFDCDIHIHRGAGAYEAGEETALLESLEGKRAQPRLKPPFPAVAGCMARPPRSTTSKRCRTCRSCCCAAPRRTRRSGPRRTAARSCIASAATWPSPACTKRR